MITCHISLVSIVGKENGRSVSSGKWLAEIESRTCVLRFEGPQLSLPLLDFNFPVRYRNDGISPL